MTEKISTDQQCGIWKFRALLLLPSLEAETTAPSQYPRTLLSFSLALRRALVDLEVLLFKSGANTLCRRINYRIIHLAKLLLWCH